MSVTSLSLIQRLRQPDRDGAAWARFVQLYSPLLHYWARKVGLNEDQSLDVTQEVLLLLLLEKLPAFEHDGRTFRGWLRTIIQNKCRDYLRRRRHEPQLAGSDVERNMPAVDDLETFSEAEYRSFVLREAPRLIQSEFQDSTWQAFWLTEMEGLAARQAAEQLGLTENAVFVARSRVKRRLRQEFASLLD